MKNTSATSGANTNREHLPSRGEGERHTNIELLRILAMILIVAHHYVVNSTVRELFDLFHATANSIFLQLWGMWGKMAINVFVLITGYFMCTKRLTVRRYCKILFPIVFYSWLMWLILCCAGYETFSWTGVWNRLICHNLLVGQNQGFTPAFMWMYLTIPFMNVYIEAASRRNLYAFIEVLLSMFSVCATLFNARLYHHVFWYMTLYLVGAAIRLYPCTWMNRNRVCVPALIGTIILAWGSVLGLDCASIWWGWPIWHAYYMVVDSNKLLAFAVALFAFLVFKNWKIPQSRFINTVASTTFGVLLIHAASDGMRKWLWQDFVNVPKAYLLPLPKLAEYSLFVAVAVFSVCSLLDYGRICLIERPLFHLWAQKRQSKP